MLLIKISKTYIIQPMPLVKPFKINLKNFEPRCIASWDINGPLLDDNPFLSPRPVSYWSLCWLQSTGKTNTIPRIPISLRPSASFLTFLGFMCVLFLAFSCQSTYICAATSLRKPVAAQKENRVGFGLPRVAFLSYK